MKKFILIVMLAMLAGTSFAKTISLGDGVYHIKNDNVDGEYRVGNTSLNDENRESLANLFVFTMSIYGSPSIINKDVDEEVISLIKEFKYVYYSTDKFISMYSYDENKDLYYALVWRID